jgi:DNA-binding transcriptional regulator YhcF (GntR family)
MHAIQLAQSGIKIVVPTVIGQPLMARANCSTATMAKIRAAKSEKFLAVISVPPQQSEPPMGLDSTIGFSQGLALQARLLPRVPRPRLAASPGSVVPLYFQLQEILKEKIEIGLWSAGEAIPPEADLCATYGVSRTVVRQALAILEQDRQIIRVRGSGTFVAVPKVEQRAGGFSRLLTTTTPGARITILDARTQTASRRIGSQLGLKVDSGILRVMSLLHIRDVPVALKKGISTQAPRFFS